MEAMLGPVQEIQPIKKEEGGFRGRELLRLASPVSIC